MGRQGLWVDKVMRRSQQHKFLYLRVSDILEMLAENISAAEILEDFPDLEMADIQACLVFAARRTDFSRLTA
jgi:uncharacterized protein (DUF433 family)